jgi:radical SAM superfamily enzyme YgiQ (UPF0313 family)
MIVFYNPVSSAGRKPVIPLALAQLAANIVDLDWSLVDGNIEDESVASIVAMLRDTSHPILAVTLMPGPQLSDAFAVTKQVRATVPGLIVVWGGYFPTQHAELVARSPLVDFVFKGHGEAGFPTLVDGIRQGVGAAELSKIEGVTFVGEDGLLLGGQTASVPDPQILPELPWSRINVNAYARKTTLGNRTIGYHSSYGCPFFCNFCAVVTMDSGRWRAQSAERVAAVAERYSREYSADAIEFYDNNFFVSEGRVREFAERITPLGMSWWGEGRIDRLMAYSDDTWATMARSGLKMVFLGAESSSTETLERMQKGGSVTPEMTLELAQRASAYGVIPEFSFVMGVPPDPASDVEAGIQFIRRVKKVNPSSEIIMYLYSPEPVEGELLEAAKGKGFRFPDTLEGWMDPEWERVVQRRNSGYQIPRLALQRLRGFERVLNAYYPTSTDKNLTGLRKSILFGTSFWRYKTEHYRWAVELGALQKWFKYQRPETSGF